MLLFQPPAVGGVALSHRERRRIVKSATLIGMGAPSFESTPHG